MKVFLVLFIVALVNSSSSRAQEALSSHCIRTAGSSVSAVYAHDYIKTFGSSFSVYKVSKSVMYGGLWRVLVTRETKKDELSPVIIESKKYVVELTEADDGLCYLIDITDDYDNYHAKHVFEQH